MRLDAGILALYHVTGDIGAEQKRLYLRGWYGLRIVGATRYFAARQVDARVDCVARILRPPAKAELQADDLCMLADKQMYRIVQAQELRDEEAGEDVTDLSLERIGGRYDD